MSEQTTAATTSEPTFTLHDLLAELDSGRHKQANGTLLDRNGQKCCLGVGLSCLIERGVVNAGDKVGTTYKTTQGEWLADQDDLEDNQLALMGLKRGRNEGGSGIYAGDLVELNDDFGGDGGDYLAVRTYLRKRLDGVGHNVAYAVAVGAAEKAGIVGTDNCSNCGASVDDGEGYDGLCGNCADRGEDDAQLRERYQ